MTELQNELHKILTEEKQENVSTLPLKQCVFVLFTVCNCTKFTELMLNFVDGFKTVT